MELVIIECDECGFNICVTCIEYLIDCPQCRNTFIEGNPFGHMWQEMFKQLSKD